MKVKHVRKLMEHMGGTRTEGEWEQGNHLEDTSFVVMLLFIAQQLEVSFYFLKLNFAFSFQL